LCSTIRVLKGLRVAIQNFISGGFYGKLGDVVGQRWHNKRVIRTHVIPYNPRTEKQQANRQLFALATALAQEAYNLNKGSPLWDTTKMGQFSQMVGLAKRRLQAGMSPSEALPLYPDGHISNVTLSNPSANWSAWPGRVTITDDSYTFTDSRTMDIIIQAFDERQNQWVFFNDAVTIPAGSQFSYSFDTDNRYSIPAGGSVQAASSDDASFSGSSIQLPALSLTQPSKVTIQTPIAFSPFVYLSGFEAIRSTITTDLLNRDFSWEIEFRGWYIPDGDWYEDNTIIEFNSDGTAFYTLDTSEANYPSGSYIEGGSYTWTDEDTANFSFTWSRFNFTWP